MTNMNNFNSMCDKLINFPYTTEQLNVIKSQFEAQINSARRLSQITNLKQILQVLQKRDYLNPSNTVPLNIIALLLNQPNLFNSINNTNQEALPQEENPVFPAIPIDAKQRVYIKIAEEIGKKWQTFARALNIKEGKIDELEKVLPFEKRILAILIYHEQNCDQRTWKTHLLNALLEARRKDLKRDVEYIFDTC